MLLKKILGAIYSSDETEVLRKASLKPGYSFSVGSQNSDPWKMVSLKLQFHLNYR